MFVQNEHTVHQECGPGTWMTSVKNVAWGRECHQWRVWPGYGNVISEECGPGTGMPSVKNVAQGWECHQWRMWPRDGNAISEECGLGTGMSSVKLCGLCLSVTSRLKIEMTLGKCWCVVCAFKLVQTVALLSWQLETCVSFDWNRNAEFIFTDHVRCTRESNVFVGVCLATRGGCGVGTLPSPSPIQVGKGPTHPSHFCPTLP